MLDWAAETKRIKADFFMTRQDAERYHRGVYENLGHIRVKNLIEVQHVLEHARGSVLDVGTGTGRFAIPLFDGGHAVTGCDISPEMLAVAEEAAQGRGIAWMVGDVERLPFPDGSFDTVTCINVVTHLPQWQSCIREFQRVVKPGGRIIFDMCSGDIIRLANSDGPHYGYVTKDNDKAHFFAEVPVQEMCNFLEESELSIEAIIPHDFFNSNYLIQKALGRRYKAFNDRVTRSLIESESVFRFWCFVERYVISRLPTEFVYDYIVVAINGPGGKGFVPPPLKNNGSPVSGRDFLERCLGQDFAFVIDHANSLLKDRQAYEFFRFVYNEFLVAFDPASCFEDLFGEATRAQSLARRVKWHIKSLLPIR